MLRAAPLFCALLVTGCGSQPASPVANVVDKDTGESFARPLEPVRLLATRPALSRVGKDYLFVAPVTLSGGGSGGRYLWFSIGSSVDRRITGAPIPDINEVVLVLDGMPMTFDLTEWSVIAGSEPFEPGVEYYASFGAKVTRSQLRRIAQASAMHAYVTNGEQRSPTYALAGGDYAVWTEF